MFGSANIMINRRRIDNWEFHIWKKVEKWNAFVLQIQLGISIYFFFPGMAAAKCLKRQEFYYYQERNFFCYYAASYKLFFCENISFESRNFRWEKFIVRDIQSFVHKTFTSSLQFLTLVWKQFNWKIEWNSRF